MKKLCAQILKAKEIVQVVDIGSKRQSSENDDCKKNMVMAAGKKEKKILTLSGNVGSPGTQPERRVSERFPSKLEARIFYGNVIYAGMVTNLSKSGMFVNTNIRFPVNSELMMVVLMNNSTVKVPIKVRRAAQNVKDHPSSKCRGIGVELLETPQNYLEYVDSRNPSIHLSS